MNKINKSNKSAVSPVLGVILMVAVTVALVTLFTLTVFDIGGNTSDPVDGTVVTDVNTDSRSLTLEVLRNENIENIKVRGADSPSIVSSEGDVGSEKLAIKNGVTKVEILAVVDGREQILDTIDLPQEVTQPVNLLTNPSFESTGGWDFSDTDVQRSSSSNPSFDGSFSASMKDLTQNYDGRILESNSFSVDAGVDYNVEVYYNIQMPSGSRDSDLDEYSVEIVWLDASNNEISHPGKFGDFPNPGKSWEKVSISEKAPSNAESAKLKIRSKERGTNNPTVYWDSASVSKPLN